MSLDRTNVICGLFLIVVGAVFAFQSLLVPLGTFLRIGPGGVPLVLSATLIILGGIVLVARHESREGFGGIPWRGMFFILLAPIIFSVTIRPLGFVAAVFLTTLFASFASVKMKPVWALNLAVALTVFTTLVFSYGLRLPFERFGPWLRF